MASVGSTSGSIGEESPSSPKFNAYSQESQYVDDWSIAEDGNSSVVGTIDKDDARKSASAVASANTAAGKAHNYLLATVMVNSFHMDLCASSEDAELQDAGKDVKKWQAFMKSLDDEFPSYPHYK